MLILTRDVDQRIMIGDDIEITVLNVINGQVRIGIDAPREIPVHREEVYHRVRREQRDPDAIGNQHFDADHHQQRQSRRVY